MASAGSGDGVSTVLAAERAATDGLTRAEPLVAAARQPFVITVYSVRDTTMSQLPNELINQILCGDCVELMAELLPDGCVDLVFADPPFNAGKDYGSGFNDDKEISEYYDWLSTRLEGMKRVLKTGGTLWLMNDTRHIGFCQNRLDSMGLTFRNMIVWAYTNPTPAKHHLPKTWRPILFYSKGNLACLHPERVKLSKETLYHNPGRAKAHPVHDLWPDIPKLVGGFLAPPELLTTPEGRFAHLAQMPEKIAERIILLASEEGQVVFDPMCGSGAILKAAKQLGRSYLGIDISPEYVELAKQRLIETNPPLFTLG